MHYLKETIPKMQEGVFAKLIILVVKENGALSAIDGYCTYVY